jgi:hypothetical protein
MTVATLSQNVAVTVEKDGSKLGKRIAAFRKQMTSLSTEAHILAVSAVYHAANSGRGEVLSDFYNALTPAWQGSFRAWLGERGCNAAGFLSFKREGGIFKVPEGKMEARDAFKAKADAGEFGRPFWIIDTNQNTNIFDTKAFVGRVNGLLNACFGDTAQMTASDRALAIEIGELVAKRMKGSEAVEKLATNIIDKKKSLAAVAKVDSVKVRHPLPETPVSRKVVTKASRVETGSLNA